MQNTRHALMTAVCLVALVACRGRDSEYDDTSRVHIDTAAGFTDMREYTEAELLGLIGQRGTNKCKEGISQQLCRSI